MNSIKKVIVIMITVSVLFVPALASAQHNHQHGPAAPGIPGGDKNEQALINQLKGKDAKQAVALANEWRLENRDVVSFVTPEAVHFKFKSGTETSIPLPQNQMMVSVAPYIHWTHPCSTHYISKCDAELKDIPVKIRAVDAKGGVLIDRTLTSPTGFFDLWLPRDQEITLDLSAQGKKVKGKITTYRDSPTCNSTLKLE